MRSLDQREAHIEAMNPEEKQIVRTLEKQYSVAKEVFYAEKDWRKEKYDNLKQAVPKLESALACSYDEIESDSSYEEICEAIKSITEIKDALSLLHEEIEYLSCPSDHEQELSENMLVVNHSFKVASGDFDETVN